MRNNEVRALVSYLRSLFPMCVSLSLAIETLQQFQGKYRESLERNSSKIKTYSNNNNKKKNNKTL